MNGAASPKSQRGEDSARGGWGVWLTPAHCHSERRNATGRVERYREAAEVIYIGPGSPAAAHPASSYPPSLWIFMNVFELTRALIDIDSVTPNEEQVGVYLADYLSALAARTGGHVERIEVEPHRYNVLAYWDAPVVTLSTHIDTVPPFFASREDDEFIWGRGACDTKGIIASMIFAVEALLARGRAPRRAAVRRRRGAQQRRSATRRRKIRAAAST